MTVPAELEPALRAIVTGAANGIGFAVAERLRADGMTVVGLDREPGRGIVVVDLANDADRDRALGEAVDRLGGVDVLVNVAGIFRHGAIHESDLGTWRGVWAVDLEAPIALMRGCAQRMIAGGFGRIVNITSVHARFAQPSCLAYDVGKAGLEAATRSAALDLARHGILVNAIAPGFVKTRMSVVDGEDETEEEPFRRAYVESGKLPLGRAAEPYEIAATVAWLAGRDNTYVTGHVLTADGGLTTTF